jgi:hypothetical protein
MIPRDPMGIPYNEPGIQRIHLSERKPPEALHPERLLYASQRISVRSARTGPGLWKVSGLTRAAFGPLYV